MAEVRFPMVCKSAEPGGFKFRLPARPVGAGGSRVPAQRQLAVRYGHRDARALLSHSLAHWPPRPAWRRMTRIMMDSDGQSLARVTVSLSASDSEIKTSGLGKRPAHPIIVMRGPWQCFRISRDLPVPSLVIPPGPGDCQWPREGSVTQLEGQI